MPIKPRATQEDVAKMAGVSQAMVSYVVNNNPTVKIPEETRQRILETMQKLSYVPNASARGLRSGKTRTIGLVVPDNSNPFFAEFARIIEDYGFENGYSLILCNSDYDIKKENTYIDVMLAKQVDGMIFISSGKNEEIQTKLSDCQIPHVIVGREISGSCTDTVTIDYQQGAYLATKYLLDLGHSKIACITGPAQFSSSSQRLDGYFQALHEVGLPIDMKLVVQGDFRIHGGEESMAQLLELLPRPTAVFVCNDLMAIGVIQAARRFGVRVPDELSVVGFDDIPLARSMYPSLTTIAQPITEIASIAMNMLLKQIYNTPEDFKTKKVDQIRLQPSLVIRESTAKWTSQ